MHGVSLSLYLSHIIVHHIKLLVFLLCSFFYCFVVFCGRISQTASGFCLMASELLLALLLSFDSKLTWDDSGDSIISWYLGANSDRVCWVSVTSRRVGLLDVKLNGLGTLKLVSEMIRPSLWTMFATEPICWEQKESNQRVESALRRTNFL